MELPKINSEWEHSNGNRYIVGLITNEHSTNHEKYPITIVYRGKLNCKLWSRPLHDWHRSMTLISKW